MSSTNRGGDRHVSDYYVTPQIEIRKFLDRFVQREQYAMSRSILDPCAGGSATDAMSYPAALREFGCPGPIYTMDIREDSPAEMHDDYLTVAIDPAPHLIITNPPFFIAREVIEKALRDVDANGFVVMLLRLNFLGSRGRREFWRQHMPKYIFVHPERISFTPDGKTDSIEYAHFVWQKSFHGSQSLLELL